MITMSFSESEWLSLTAACRLLGVHSTTLRRWTDSGDIPHVRTPGGHRRFRAADLVAWIDARRELAPQSTGLVQTALGFTRQEMAHQRISRESWYTAFDQNEEREQMRDTGRRLFGLAVQFVSRARDREPIIQEGRRIGEFYGQQSAGHGVSLVNMMRAFFFFRESLLRVAKPGQVSPGCYDAEDVRVHRQLRYFLDEVMYACLAGYEAACPHLLPEGKKV
jgi:excisionase family DNA binding protein